MGYLKDEILEKVATSEDNIIFEEAVYSIASQAFSRVMREVFEDVDQRLVSKDESRWICHGKKGTTAYPVSIW